MSTIEDGQRVFGYDYHKVYSDGNFVYDPLFSRTPVPIANWEKAMHDLNRGNIIIK